MKKKILIALMAVLLAVAMIFTVVACNPKPPRPGPTPPKPDTDPIPEVVEPKGNDVLGILVEGLNGSFNGVVAVEKQLYAKATLYVQYGETRIAIKIAATMDSDKLANNKALLAVSLDKGDGGAMDLAQIYVENEVVYFGDGITKEGDPKWVRLDQVKEMNFVGGALSGLPKIIADFVASKKEVNVGGFLKGTIGKDFIKQFLPSAIMGIVGDILIKPVEVPADYFIPDADNEDDDKERSIVGDYKMELDLSKISGLLDSLKNIIDLRETLNKLLEGLDAGMKGIIDTVCNTVLGGSLDEFLAGTIDPKDAPTLGVTMTIAEDESLSDVGITYNKGTGAEATVVAFGIEDFEVSENSAKDITPAGLKRADMDNVDNNLALTATVALDLPIKGVSASITGYILPEISLSRDADGYVAINFDKLKGAAYATITGKDDIAVDVPIAIDFQQVTRGEGATAYKTFQMRFDLAGLFKLLGMTDAKTKYYADFNIQKAYDDAIAKQKEADKVPPAAAKIANADVPEPEKATALDSLLTDIVGLINGTGSKDIMAIITGNIGNALAVVQEVLAGIQAGNTSLETDEATTLHLGKIFAALIKDGGLIATSEFLIGDKLLSDYANASKFIGIIGSALKMEAGALAGYIGSAVGITMPTDKTGAELDKWLGEWLLNNDRGVTVTVDGFRNSSLGADISISCDGKKYIGLTAKMNIITAKEAKAAIAANKAFDGWTDADATDLGEKANLDAFGATMKTAMDKFFAFA